jgi:mannose-6-phosphate isomerase-like protein (cupin superfamily)
MSREFKYPEKISEWKQDKDLPKGVEEIILYRDEDSGTYARLVRVEPGWKGGTKPRKHDFDEVVYIIQGGMIDHLTGKAYTSGMFASFPTGLEHGPLDCPEGTFTIEFRHYRRKVAK